MNQKRSALIFLLMLSTVIPLVEMQVEGEVNFFGKFAALEAGLDALGIYWWYLLDKKQIAFRTGPIQNIGVIVFAVAALPIYFVRSRGWRLGGVSTMKAIGFFVAMNICAVIGEFVGHELAL